MAETWVLNEQLDPVLQLSKTTIPFTSNGQAYAAISFQNRELVYYTNPYSSSGTSAYAPRGPQGYWTNSAYRTITFDGTPTGALLSWLQKNGTKQIDPEPPEPTTPKNACLIDGTGYSIKQGKVLIDGTAYTVKKGRTLIDGTMYNIVLTEDKIMHTITITGILYNKSCVKTSTATYSTTGSFEVEDGETITVVAGAKRSTYLGSARVYLNGTQVAQGQNGIGATYSMTVTSDVEVEYMQKGTGVNSRNWAYITT